MQDEKFPIETQVSQGHPEEPPGALKRALYLWERQPPSVSHSHFDGVTRQDEAAQSTDTGTRKEPRGIGSFNMPGASNREIDENLRRHASRLAALERLIPGDRRLDSPRFSLMMLNAFFGRAVTDGAVPAGLPGLLSISDRIDHELADLEHEFPAVLEPETAETDVTLHMLRHDMNTKFAEMASIQKAQQRQLVSSLAALHTALSDIRTNLPTADANLPSNTTTAMPQIDDIARPLLDPNRLVDPRPVLAAARAAASQVHIEDVTRENPNPASRETLHPAKPFRSVLVGSAILGVLMMMFGRDAVQFLQSTSIHNAFARP